MTASARPFDLRLAGLAVAAWLAALASLHLSTTAASVIAASAALVAAALTVFLLSPAGWARRPAAATYGWIAVAVLLGVLCGAGATGARLSVRDAGEIRDLADRRALVTATLVVRDDPRPVRGVAGRPQAFLVPTGLVRLAEGDRPAVTARARIVVLANGPAWRDLLPGQQLSVRGRLAAPQGGDLTAAMLSAAGPPQLIGQPSWAQRAAGSLRDGLQRACAPLADEPGGLLPGLVVGDTSRLLPTVEEDFRSTGLTHLVAVSGSNVAIVVGFVLLLARWARFGPALSAAACAVALVGFVILARPSPSVIRAATMGAIGLAALAAGRPRAAVPALCTAVAALVVADPALAGDPGFALSVLATAGLLLLAPGWRDALRRRGVPTGVAEALAIPASAQLACAPVVAGLSGTVSLVAVPANLLAVPAIAPATVLGVAAAVVSPVWLPAAEFAAWLASWPAWWLVIVARTGARLPAGTLPWLDGVGGALLLATLTVAVLVGMRHPVVRRLVLVTAVAVAVGALPVRFVASGWPPKGWLVVACAVGQGDAIVLPAAADRAVVIDAGPEPPPVDRCLRRLGVREVSMLVISHLHADHVGGVAGVFRGRQVNGVVAPDFAEPEAARRDLLAAAAAAGAPVRLASAGWAYRDGQLELVALGPTHALRGTRSDPNNNSLVLLARVRGVGILLPGDAEGEEQRALLDRHGAAGLRADVLKVPHHGSAYQDPGFLDAVDPRVALVSAGVGNRYGHPNPSLLDRLADDGARVLRTDTQGDLAAVDSGNGLAVVVRGIEPGRASRAASLPRGPPGPTPSPRSVHELLERGSEPANCSLPERRGRDVCDRPASGGGLVDRSRLNGLLERERDQYARRNPRSAAAYARAEHLFGRVPMTWMNKQAAGFPLYLASARGSHVTDLDGHDYVDLCLGDTGAMAGHSPAPVTEAVTRRLATLGGATAMMPTEDAEWVGAELTRRFGLPRWSFSLTATDANRWAIRLARAVTGRPKILVNSYCYHGSVDESLIVVGDDGEGVSRPGNVGAPCDVTLTSRVAEFNDVDGLQRQLAHGDVAAVLMEPALTNIGIVLPEPGYLDAVRALTRQYGTLFINDETHTFSAGPGGCTGAWGLTPDVVTIGKAIGGGVPIGAYGLSAELADAILGRDDLDLIDMGGVGGTLAGNALSVAAARATLEHVLTDAAFEQMTALADTFTAAVIKAIETYDLPWSISQLGARAEYRFARPAPRDGSSSARASDAALEDYLHLYLANRGVLLTPFHNMALMSPATTAADVDCHSEVFTAALAELLA